MHGTRPGLSVPRHVRCCAAALVLAITGAAGCGSVRDPDANAAPTAAPAAIATYMGTPIEGQLEASDADGDPLVYAIASEPAAGTLALEEDGRFVYVPDRGHAGEDSFAFEVSDGQAVSEPAAVSISIATLTDGTLDDSFGAGGAVSTDFGAIDSFSGVTVQADGRVVAVGGTGSAFALVARYTPDGALDASFSESGSARFDAGPGYDGLGDVAQQAGGRLVAVGQSQDTDRDFLLIGLDSAGALDESFGDGGVVKTDAALGGDDVARVLRVLPDDRLLVAGYAHNGTDDDFAVARYDADGALDGSFGEDGVAVIDFGGADRAIGMAIDDDGNIILVGEADGDAGVARLLPEGELDDGFGEGGRLAIDVGEYDEGAAVVVGPNGALYVGGSSNASGAFQMVVFRVSAGGALDETFGEGGMVPVTGDLATSYTFDMLLLPNRTLLLVGGGTRDDVSIATAARFQLTGEPDPSFGEGGLWTGSFASDGDDTLFAAALQPDGKLVAAGWSRNTDLDGILLRLGW